MVQVVREALSVEASDELVMHVPEEFSLPVLHHSVLGFVPPEGINCVPVSVMTVHPDVLAKVRHPLFWVADLLQDDDEFGVTVTKRLDPRDWSPPISRSSMVQIHEPSAKKKNVTTTHGPSEVHVDDSGFLSHLGSVRVMDDLAGNEQVWVGLVRRGKSQPTGVGTV